MEVKPGFKHTEVGVIPEDWRVAPLGKHATFRTGPFGSALHKSDYTNDGVPVVNPMHIVDGNIEPTWTMTISETVATRLSDFRMTPGEIVIGRRGDMGRCAVVQEHHKGWLCGTGSMIIRLVNVDANFLQRVLSSPRAIAAIEDSSVGTTMVNLNQGTLAGLKVQIPPLPEQRAIAEALSNVDGLLIGLDRLIAKKRDLKQAAMQQLLTGQTRLPGFRGEWEVKHLKKIVETPVTDGPHLTPQFFNDGIPFLSVNNLVANKIDLGHLRFISQQDHEVFSRKCKPQKGDILLGKAASVGKVAIVELTSEFNIWSPIALIRVSGSHCARFIYFQLQSADLISQITLLTNSSSQGNIGMGDIERLTLKLPSHPEQSAIASVLTEMDAEIAALEQRRDKTRALKQAMMQELLTGRTRLV